MQIVMRELCIELLCVPTHHDNRISVERKENFDVARSTDPWCGLVFTVIAKVR